MSIERIRCNWSECSFKMCFNALLSTQCIASLNSNESVSVSFNMSMLTFLYTKSNTAVKTSSFRALAANEKLKQDAQTYVPDATEAMSVLYIA